MDEWVKKMWYLYTGGILLTDQKRQIHAILTTWMELEEIISEINQEEKDKYWMVSQVKYRENKGSEKFKLKDIFLNADYRTEESKRFPESRGIKNK